MAPLGASTRTLSGWKMNRSPGKSGAVTMKVTKCGATLTPDELIALSKVLNNKMVAAEIEKLEEKK